MSDLDEMVEGSEEQLLDDGLDEFVVEDEAASGEEKVELSKEEYEKLTREGKTDEQIVSAIDKLTDIQAGMQTATRPQPVSDPFALPLNAPAEEDDNFEEQLWEKGQSASAVDKRIERYVKPIMTRQQARINASELRAQLAENPDLKPYEGEIKQMIASLTPEQKSSEYVVQGVVNSVRMQHLDEIIKAKADELLKERSGSGDATASSPSRQSDFSEGLGGAGATTVAATKTVAGGKHKLTRAQVTRYEEAARQIGVTARDYFNNYVLPARERGEEI